jgi:hypothetical protein
LPATLGNWVTRFTDHLVFFEKPEHGLLISNSAENALTWSKVLLIMKNLAWGHSSGGPGWFPSSLIFC